MSTDNVNRAKLIEQLQRRGFHTTADNVRHGVCPGSTAATLTEIADHAEDAGLGDAAGIIRRAVEQAGRDTQRELDEAINYQARAAERTIRDAAGFQGGDPETLEVMVGKLDAMAQRTADETGLDAADSLTWHVRQVLYNSSDLVAMIEQLTRDHLEARDPCTSCNGSDQPAERGKTWADAEHTVTKTCSLCDGAAEKRRYPHQLGDVLKDWYEQLCGVGGLEWAVHTPRDKTLIGNDEGQFQLPEPASALLSAALAWVDWRELATDAISNYEAEHANEESQS